MSVKNTNLKQRNRSKMLKISGYCVRLTIKVPFREIPLFSLVEASNAIRTFSDVRTEKYRMKYPSLHDDSLRFISYDRAEYILP